MSAVLDPVQTPAPAAEAVASMARLMSLGPLRADCELELSGVLVRADVAMKPLGDGHFVPAIVLEIDDVGAGHHRLVAHVPYPREKREEADARCKALRIGARISVRTHLVDMRLLLPAASISSDNS
jgi:hypothetical protein